MKRSQSSEFGDSLLSGDQRAVHPWTRVSPKANCPQHRPHSDSGKPARAAKPPGCKWKKIRRAARGQCLRLGSSYSGGADSARPGCRRMASPSDRRWPRKHTELAYPPAPLQGPPPGLPRPRPGRAAGAALGACSGTDPDANAPCPPQARTGDPPLPVRQEPEPRPGGWLCTSLERAARQRNRVGLRLLPPATLTFARPSRRHSLPPASKRSRSIRPRE